MIKLRAAFLGFIAGLCGFGLLVRCAPVQQSESSQTPAEVAVEMKVSTRADTVVHDSTRVKALFSRDGCKVYSFEDAAGSIHFLVTRIPDFLADWKAPCEVTR